MTPPRWEHQRAVAAFVAAQLDELRSECERLGCPMEDGYTVFEPTEPPELVEMWRLTEIEHWTPSDEEANTEEKAVAAALRGNLKPLANLIQPIQYQPEPNIPDQVNPNVKFFSASTWEIVAQFLTGERNLKTGRLKGEPGRPKMSIEQRRNFNPVHRAADEARVIIAILKRHYPRRSQHDIVDRAAKIAADRNGARHETLLKHLGRPAARRIS
jgi:hypothetical protein